MTEQQTQASQGAGPISQLLADRPGFGNAGFTKDEHKALAIEPQDHMIRFKDRLNKVIYVEGVHCRNLLNNVFGRGNVGFLRINDEMKDNKVFVDLAIVVRGNVVAEATGSSQKPNRVFDYSDAIESASTNAIMRGCKHMGVFSAMWEESFRQSFYERCCVMVWCQDSTGKVKRPLWRLKTEPPIYNYEVNVGDGKAYLSESKQGNSNTRANTTRKAPAKEAAPARKYSTANPPTPDDVKSSAATKQVTPYDYSKTRKHAKPWKDTRGVESPFKSGDEAGTVWADVELRKITMIYTSDEWSPVMRQKAASERIARLAIEFHEKGQLARFKQEIADLGIDTDHLDCTQLPDVVKHLKSVRDGI